MEMVETVYDSQWLMEQGIYLLNDNTLAQNIRELQFVPLPA